MAKDEIKGFDTALNDTKNLENGKTYDKYEKTIKNYFIDMAEEEIKDGDLILLVGKGHEEYQDIKGVKHPFSELEVIEEIKKNLK